MTHPAYIREKAVQLRTKNKLTIDEIAERLDLSRTTVYHWVRDLEIPRTARQSAAMVERNRQNVARWKALRDAAYEEGTAMYSQLSAEPGFRDFVVLYVAEGYKRNRNIVAISNSEPAVIRAALPWINRFSDNPVRFWVQHHADQEIDDLRRAWAKELGIDGNAISFQRKSNSGMLSGRTWRCRLGVLTVRTADTYFRSRLQAWIDEVHDEWDRGFNLKASGRGAAW